MSITVDFAFNAAGNLAAIHAMASSALGVMLQPYDGDADDLHGTLLGLGLSLSTTEHLENDRELNFSSYRYLLSTRTPSSTVALRVYQVEATALAAISLLLVGGVGDGLLCYDVQVLLARYAVDRDVIHDAVSSKAVQLPQHLVDLRTRVPR